MSENKKRSPLYLLLPGTIFILGCIISNSIFADGSENLNPSLIGTWRWMGTVTPVEIISPIPGEEYSVSFNEDGTISMKLETNQINGRYTVDGGKLKVVPPMMMTLAAWLPESPAPSILKLMEHAVGYFFKEDELYIDTYADGGTLRFESIS